MEEDILEISDVLQIMREKGRLTPAYDYYKPTVTVGGDLEELERIVRKEREKGTMDERVSEMLLKLIEEEKK